jgi:hypothetical protein
MSFIRLRHDCTMEALIAHAAIESKKFLIAMIQKHLSLG